MCVWYVSSRLHQRLKSMFLNCFLHSANCWSLWSCSVKKMSKIDLCLWSKLFVIALFQDFNPLWYFGKLEATLRIAWLVSEEFTYSYTLSSKFEFIFSLEFKGVWKWHFVQTNGVFYAMTSWEKLFCGFFFIS